MMNELFLLSLVTLAVAVYLIHRLQAPAHKVGIVDVPGGRKDHEYHTPLIGGVGMFVAFSFGALLVSFGLADYRPLFAGMGLLLIVGLLDDLQDLGAREKFVLQIGAGIVLVGWGGLVVPHLGTFAGFGTLALGWAAIPFTLVCVVGLINAVNMLDGMDGLAGSVVLVILFWLIVVGLGAADIAALALPILLASAVAGFLVFNFPLRRRSRASVFMGDSGSTMLGFALAWFAIDLVFEQGLRVAPVTIAWIMALPIFDTIALMFRRVSKGRHPMSADREHLHHIFLRAGFSARATVYIAAGISFVLGGIGVLGWKMGVPDWLMWLPLLLVFGLHCLLLRHAWRAMRLLRRATSSMAAEKSG